MCGPIAIQWSAETSGPPYSPTIKYTNSNSNLGRQLYADGLYDYRATDVPYNAEDAPLGTTASSNYPYVYVPDLLTSR